MVWLDRFTYRIVASPVLWGSAVAMAFHLLIRKSGDAIPPTVLRCLTGSWDTYLGTTLFFVAMAFIVVRTAEVLIDTWVLRQSVTGTDSSDNGSAERQNGRSKAVSATEQLELLEKNSWARRSHWFHRLQEAHRLASRYESPAEVSSQIQRLSDAHYDAFRQRYSVVRLLTWAIPSVGSIATVTAVAKAVELLTPGPSDAAFASVASGLSAAFQTFAFSIGLSVILVVVRQILEPLDQRVATLMDYRLEQLFITETSSRSTNDSMQDQLRQLADGLRSISTTLAQQATLSRAGSPTPNGPSPSAAPASGMDPKDVELLVQRAVAAVAQRMPTAVVGSDGGGSSIDAAGWKSLQQVLQKLSHVLELQNAKLESEGRVSKHLSAIIDEGLSETRPALKVRNSA